MNTRQVCMQLAYLLRAQTWSSELVFGAESVLVSLNPDEEFLRHARKPLAVISPGTYTADDEEPELITRQIRVTLYHSHSGGDGGQALMIGANRASTDTSLGRGLLDLEEPLANAIRHLNEIDGISVYSKMGGGGDSAYIDGGPWYASMAHDFEVVTTMSPYHPPIANLQSTNLDSQVDLAWELPDRFDRVPVVIRHAAGSTAPATITDGNAVNNASLTASDNAITGIIPGAPVPGTHSFTVFAAYNDTAEWSASNAVSPLFYGDGVSITVDVTGSLILP